MTDINERIRDAQREYGCGLMQAKEIVELNDDLFHIKYNLNDAPLEKKRLTICYS